MTRCSARVLPMATDDEGGSRFIGLGIAIAIVAMLLLLPALTVVGFYTFANVYALITGSDFSSDTMNVAVFLTGLVVTVATIVMLIAAVVSLIGRGLSPGRRGEEDEPVAEVAGG
jgi:hypothetical protein